MQGITGNALYFFIENSGCSRAVFGAVGFIFGYNVTTANSAVGGIYGSNRRSLV